MKTVRASEIGTYLYCRRAWGYARQGVNNENQLDLRSGAALHEQHGRKVLTSGCLTTLAYALLLLGLATLLAYGLSQAL